MLMVYNRDNRELELILRSHGEFRVYYSIFNLNGYARPTEIIQNTHTHRFYAHYAPASIAPLVNCILGYGYSGTYHSISIHVFSTRRASRRCLHFCADNSIIFVALCIEPPKMPVTRERRHTVVHFNLPENAPK